MSLESGTRIQDLVPTNPAGATDFVSQGDDHIRLIKACLQGSFPSLGVDQVTLTALQINDAVRKSVAQTITQLLTLSAGLTVSGGAVTLPNASVADPALSANVPLKNAANSFTAKQTVTVAGSVPGIEAVGNDQSNARIRITNSGGGQSWDFVAGTPGASNSGLAVYDVANAATRLQLTAAGNWTLFAPSSGSPLTVNTRAAGGEIILQGATTGAINHSIQNTGGYAFVGLESITGGALLFGAPAYSFVLHAFNGQGVVIGNGNAIVARFDAGVRVGAPTGGDLGAGTINVAGGAFLNGQELGFRDLYQRTFSGNTSTAATDRGIMLTYTGSGGHTLTLDGDVPDNGCLMICNAGSAPLAIDRSGSMYWFDGSGAAAEGARTLAVGGIATVRSSGSGNYSIWGVGLS